MIVDIKATSLTTLHKISRQGVVFVAPCDGKSVVTARALCWEELCAGQSGITARASRNNESPSLPRLSVESSKINRHSKSSMLVKVV